jgi:DNA-binding MarR family transcriptional regulator
MNMAKTKSELPPDQWAAVELTLDALEPFYNLRKTMPLQYVTAFLLVAMEENQNVTEYAKRARTSQSLMTRHLADIGMINRYHKPGFGLVEMYADLMDRRNKLVRLTAKGKAIVGKMCEAFK